MRPCNSDAQPVGTVVLHRLDHHFSRVVHECLRRSGEQILRLYLFLLQPLCATAAQRRLTLRQLRLARRNDEEGEICGDFPG